MSSGLWLGLDYVVTVSVGLLVVLLLWLRRIIFAVFWGLHCHCAWPWTPLDEGVRQQENRYENLFATSNLLGIPGASLGYQAQRQVLLVLFGAFGLLWVLFLVWCESLPEAGELRVLFCFLIYWNGSPPNLPLTSACPFFQRLARRTHISLSAYSIPFCVYSFARCIKEERSFCAHGDKEVLWIPKCLLYGGEKKHTAQGRKHPGT